jgi:transposase
MNQPLFELPEGKQEGKKKILSGKARVEQAQRQQMEMRVMSVDELLPVDHRVRVVWEMVEAMNLSKLYARIASVEGGSGRPAIDPALLVAVWLYATLEGVGSARQLERLCQEQLSYQWLLGGVSINYHTLADFRVGYEAELDELLVKGVAALMESGLVKLEQTAQDGIRIRAHAGASSFRRKETLQGHLQQAEARVQELKAEREASEASQDNGRKQAAQERAARERVERVKRALEAVEEVEAKKAKNRESKREDKPGRGSTTDGEARVMKMSDGGFRPALNGQLVVDMPSRVIVAVAVSNEVDQRQLEPVVEQVHKDYQRWMKEHYVDGGFRTNHAVERLEQLGVQVYTPIPRSYNKAAKQPPEVVQEGDGTGVKAWKERMVTEEAQKKYKQRAATIEWANALARNRGLQRLLVNGIHKVRAVLLWFALAHNLIQSLHLRQGKQMQAVSG